MKRLTCEMCGSTELIKQEGVFVCQFCGCKYSVDEAKKMMVEGTVDVSGSTIKIDTSAKLKNLYTLARRAKDDNNSQDAAKYYHEIRLEDPNSWEAAFYGVYFTAIDCKIGQIDSAANSVTNTIDTVCKLIQEHVPQEDQKAAYTECLMKATYAGEMFFNGALRVASIDIIDFVGKVDAALLTITTAGLAAENIFDDYRLALSIHSKAVELGDSFKYTVNRGKVSREKVNDLKSKIKAWQQRKNEAYWKEHAEEKEKLEKEKNLLAEKIEEKKRYIETIPEVEDVDHLEERIKELKSKRSELGLFKGKEKKALQDKIISLENDLSKANIEKEKIVNPILNQISELKYRMGQIDSELSKER